MSFFLSWIGPAGCWICCCRSACGASTCRRNSVLGRSVSHAHSSRMARYHPSRCEALKAHGHAGGDVVLVDYGLGLAALREPRLRRPTRIASARPHALLRFEFVARIVSGPGLAVGILMLAALVVALISATKGATARVLLVLDR